MCKLFNKLVLTCCLLLPYAPLSLADDSETPASISWLDLIAMQRQVSQDAMGDTITTTEEEIVSRLVEPSAGRVPYPTFRVVQIPQSEIFLSEAEPLKTLDGLVQSSEATIEQPTASLTPNLQIPSAAQLELAAIALTQPVLDALAEDAIVRRNPVYAASRIVVREPAASIPVVYAIAVNDLPARESGRPQVQTRSEAELRDSYTVASTPAARPAALPATGSAPVELELQNIGSYSADSDPLMRIQAQLELSESRNEASAVEASSEENSSIGEAASGFSMEFSKQLLGLFVDGEEQPALIAAHDGNEYLLPLVTILASSGASLDPDAAQDEATSIKVNTPGGPAVLSEADLRLVDGQLMITQTALAEILLIETSFDQSSFALYLVLPWSLSQQSEFLAFSAPEPDFTPPTASIRNMRADLFYVANNSGNDMNGDYFFSGNLAGGGWRFRAEQHGDQETTPTEYYWAKDWGKSMLLAGNSNYSLHPLLPTVEQTGVQYLYSNTPLPTSRGADITSTNGTKRIANGIRDISGTASPGAVAELRIDGRVETRTRVRLDGSYDFPGVELPTRGYSEIIVHVLDNRTRALIETQDFSRRSGIELLADGQQTVFSAFGQQGNMLDGRRESQGASTAVQWRYGLTEDLTLELGRQQVGDQIGNEAAVSMAFSNHWFGSLAFADGMNRSSVGFDLEGGADKWNLDLSMREFNLKDSDSLPAWGNQDYSLGLADTQNTVPEAGSKQWARSINFRYQLSENFTLGLLGRDTSTTYEQSNFVLPTASWSNRKNLSISARPNSAGEYRIDSRFSPNQHGSIRYAYEDQSHLLDYRYSSRSGREYYASFSADDESSGRFETGMVSHFENQRFGTLQMGLVNGDSGVGYSLEWEATFVPGVSSQLRLSKGGRDLTLSEADSDLFLQWHVTFDFAVAQKRIVPADSSSAATQSAALTGNLMLGNEKIPSRYDIDRIELLIDGDTYTARVQGGRYYIEGLQPGLHKVAIDARYLPMELSPLADQSFWVRLEKSAATEVPLGLEVKFSIAGRVQDANGVNLPYQRLLILDNTGQIVGEVYTDQFGLYRTNNVAPGSYKVMADRNGDGDAVIEVVVSDSYLFEQNLVIPVATAVSES